MLLLLPLTFFGFFRTYIDLYPAFNQKIDVYIHIHAFMATSWIFLLIIQPLLIRYKKNSWHKLLGKLSYVLFPLLLLSFTPMMINSNGENLLQEIIFQLRDIFLLLIFYGTAVYNKKNIAKHMRFMIATSLVFLFPTTGRIFAIWFDFGHPYNSDLSYIIIYAILGFLILMDLKNKKDAKPYVIAFLYFVLTHATFILVNV